jgi:murein DD-endopeptidase MepM/ murein hydrolase activator NlpD
VAVIESESVAESVAVTESVALAERAGVPSAQPVGRASPRLSWPIDPVDVRSGFGPRKDPMGGARGGLHEGLDLAAVEGQYVRAAGAGRVVRAGPAGGYGFVVVLEHGKAFHTVYAHLSTVDVFAGDEVKGGDPLGLAGATGRATGPHLHFEVRVDGRARNPFAFLPTLH